MCRGLFAKQNRRTHGIEGDAAADRKGILDLKLPPGKYVVASLVHGKFLETEVDIAPDVKNKCDQRQIDCLIAAAKKRSRGRPAHVTFKLAAPAD